MAVSCLRPTDARPWLAQVRAARHGVPMLRRSGCRRGAGSPGSYSSALSGAEWCPPKGRSGPNPRTCAGPLSGNRVFADETKGLE